MTHDDVNRLMNFLASMPGLAHSVVDRRTARDLLSRTDGQLMANGDLWEITSKHIGAGMYRVSTRRWTEVAS